MGKTDALIQLQHTMSSHACQGPLCWEAFHYSFPIPSKSIALLIVYEILDS